MKWKGVMPAITTYFDSDLQIDHEFTSRHVKWLVKNGSTGIVTNGSLGEGAALSFEEKIRLWKTCVDAVGDQAPIVAAIASHLPTLRSNRPHRHLYLPQLHHRARQKSQDGHYPTLGSR